MKENSELSSRLSTISKEAEKKMNDLESKLSETQTKLNEKESNLLRISQDFEDLGEKYNKVVKKISIEFA